VNSTNSGTGENQTCSFIQTTGGVWYVVAGTGGAITASLCGTAWDSKISVFSGPNCNTLTCVGGIDDNGPACTGLSASYTWNTTVGVNYYILVHGYSTTSPFNLAVTCVTPCTSNTVILNMNDSWGDGWNGATYTLTNSSGTVVSTGTLATGLSGNVTLCLPNGCYNMAVSAGTWPGEVSWNFNYNGNLVASGGAPTGNAQVPINIVCPPPPPTPQDCSGSQLVCADQTFNGVSSGPGNTSDLNTANQGCMSVEHQSIWLNATVANSGIYSFNIVPTGTDDYDFAVWVFPAGAAIPCPPNTPPVRCSWAAGTVTTGMGNGAVDATEDAFGDSWVSTLNVNTGEQILVLIDNFTATTSPFTLDYTGTASLGSGGVISGTNTLCEGSTSQLAGPGAPASVNPWVSSNVSVATVSNTGVVTAISAGSTLITYTNSSGCSITTTVTVNSVPSIPVISILPATCTAPSTASISNYVAGQTYSFSPIGPSISATGVISNMTIGTSYTLISTIGSCVSNASSSFSISGPLTTPSVNGVLNTCINATTQLTGSGTAAISNPWISSNPNVATVSSAGLVTGVSSGTTAITYTNSSGCSVSVTVTINDVIDWANLQFPGNGSICQGVSYTIYGQLYNTGAINTVGAGVAANGVTAQFGFSTTNSNPNSWANWTAATFNPSGGGPNNDEYMGVLSGLAPGSYYYTFRYQINGCGWQYGGFSPSGGGIWDGNIYLSGQLTITPNITPTFSAVGPFCSGATISALPTTSNNGITGTWSPAIDNTTTTTYTFTPTSGQCATTTTLTITITPNITPTFSAVGPFCSGATISALPTTSNNGIPGTWSPAIDNTTTTAYTFTPTAGQCATTATLTITINPNITPTFAVVGPYCLGATISALPTTSNNGITGTWSPSIDNTTTTTYTFTPTAGQCATTATLTITINPNITPTFTSIGPFCSGATISSLPTTSNNAITGIWSPAIDNTTTTTYTFTPTAGQCATTTTLTITITPNITPTFSAVGPFCSGATISALPTTSNNGFTGTWSPAIDNTTTTTYTFTPTAGQCATTATLTITITPNITPTFAAVGPFCSGATIGALPTTSNNGITGTWSPAIDNTTTTTYTFTPTAGQCATTATLTITITPNVTPTFAAVGPFCSGATISTLPTTSNNGITGTWSPAIDNTTTTTYTFTPTAGQCATTATLTITINPNITPTFTSIGPFCSGATIGTLPTTSNNGITGTWSPAIDNTTTATYTFTPTSGQCATTTTLTITITPNIIPTFSAVGPFCSGATISALPTTSNNGITGTWSPAIDNTTTTTYTFTPTAGQCATTVSTTINVSPNYNLVIDTSFCSNILPIVWNGQSINGPGSFTVNLFSVSGCDSIVTLNVTINSISATSSHVNVLCHGNATGSIDLTITVGTAPYVYSWNTIPTQTTEDISNLQAGVYTANISDENGCITTSSITITEPPILTAVIDSQTNVSCFGGNNGSVNITSSGGVGPYSISPAQNNLIAGSYIFTVTDDNGCQYPISAQITEPQSNLNASISNQTDVSCNGLANGSVVLSISGGTAPYSTSPSINNLSPGPNSFIVTDDNGCTASVSTTISEPSVLDAQATSTIITTSGGSSTITVTATGGTSPYSGTGSFVVTAGTYSYTVVDANGCTDVVSITITEPQNFTASSLATTILCNGGTSQITVTGNGGTPPYLGTGSFNVLAGTYTYSITDFYGNTANTTITVSEPPLLTSTSSAVPILCNGDFSAVTVSASGGVSPYTGVGVFNELAGSYTYSITDNNGCPTQTTITISEPNQINASASVVDVLCNNGFGSIDLTVSGGVGPYDILWNNTINSEDLTNVIAGTYTAVVTDQNNCQETFIYSVVNSFAPTPILTNDSGTTILTCSNTSISYSITNANSVLWDGGQTPTSSSNTFVSPGQYILDITDGNSCPIQFTVNITQNNNLPNAGINTTPNVTVLTCTNPSISVQATGDGTYSWSNGLGTNANQILNQAGTYSVTVTSSNGCSSTSSITLTSDQSSPLAVITNNTGSTTLHCNQTQINVSASGGVSYQWSNGLGTNPNVNLNTAGTYTVTATASNGCTDTETIIINQSQNPTITVSSITICSGSSGTLTAVPSTPGGSYVWTQLPSNLVLPNVTASINVSPLSNAIYNVQYFDINNCPSNAVLANVVVTPTPVVNVSGTTTICSGNNAVITANSSLTGAGGFYTWSPNTSTSQSVTVTPTVSTTYSVYYTLNGCPSNTVNHLVTVYQTPTVSVNNIGICTGTQGTLTATPSIPGGTYSWNTTPNISTTQSITLQPLNTVSYTAVYTSSNNCPSQPVTGTITVTDIPSVQLDNISVCEGQSGTLTAIPSSPGGVFIWTPSNGISGSSYTITPTASTSVSVIYSLNDCPSASVSASVTLVNTPTVSVNNIVVCQNQFGTLTANPSVPGGTYLWSTNETSQSISVNPQSDSTYSVIYFLSGCPSPQAIATATVESIPVVTFDVDFTEGCLPLTVNFTNTTPNTQDCSWNLGNGVTLNECDSLSFTYLNPGCFDISLTTNTPNGCSNTLTLNELICAYPTPVADFDLSTNELFEGNNIIYIQNNSSGGIQYIWNFGDETADTLFNPESHTYFGGSQESYILSLIAISDQGCIDSVSQIIEVSDELEFYAPNTFIPNDDGLNDVWLPVFSSRINVENYELSIYNRWGELVFKTNDFMQGWNGIYNNKLVQLGVYSFKIEFRNSNDRINQIHTGHITLVR
jgi:gliding motility-associated-like protein